MGVRGRWAAWAFAGYTAALLVATHWPGLVIHGPIDRTDLVIHAGVYTVWATLLGLSGLVRGPWWRAVIVGVVFALLDEATQPLFRRTFDLTDLSADAFGVVVGTLLAMGARARLAGRGVEGPAGDAA